MALADTISSLGTSIINLVNKRAKCDLSNINSDGEDVIRALAGGGAGVPTGTVIAYMGTTVPDGFLLMDGRVLSQETYADLYSVVGVSQLPSGATESSGVYTWTSGGITYSTGAGTDDDTHKYKMFAIADMTDGRYLMGSTVAGSRVAQCLSSQNVTISGSTGAGSSHTHGRGTWDITGSFVIPDDDSNVAFRITNQKGAFYAGTSSSGETASVGGSGTAKADRTVRFQASKNWTGTLGSESAHTHSFSNTTTIGSGDYTRPNSVSCLYLISY